MPPWRRRATRRRRPAGQWPALWAGWIDRYHPAVVAILAGRWEVSTVEWKGRWTDILDPAFAAYVRQQLQRAVDVGLVGGRRGGPLHRPLLRQRRAVRRGAVARGPTRPAERLQRARAPGGGGQPADGDPGQPRRHRLPRGHASRRQIDGVTVRAPDGVHFPYSYDPSNPQAALDSGPQVMAFGAWIGPRLWPLDRCRRPEEGASRCVGLARHRPSRPGVRVRPAARRPIIWRLAARRHPTGRRRGDRVLGQWDGR